MFLIDFAYFFFDVIIENIKFSMIFQNIRFLANFASILLVKAIQLNCVNLGRYTLSEYTNSQRQLLTS